MLFFGTREQVVMQYCNLSVQTSDASPLTLYVRKYICNKAKSRDV